MSIKINNLTYIYDKNTPYELKALDNINLEIFDGEIVGLIGHTGSGKSTLIQHLNGLLKPTEGSIDIDGIVIDNTKKDLKKLRSKVGLVFQYPEYQLFEETIRKDVAFGPKNLGVPEKDIEERVKKALGHVGLDIDEIGDKAPFNISGGQKRKVAIAGVLAMHPDILILDEPTAGLDPRSRDELLNYIKLLHNKYHITIIFVTHSMEEAARLSSRIIVMEKGRVLYDDVPKEVFKHGDDLKKIGLDVPEISKLIIRLNKKGFNIDPMLVNIDRVRDSIVSELGEKNAT